MDSGELIKHFSDILHNLLHTFYFVSMLLPVKMRLVTAAAAFIVTMATVYTVPVPAPNELVARAADGNGSPLKQRTADEVKLQVSKFFKRCCVLRLSFATMCIHPF